MWFFSERGKYDFMIATYFYSTFCGVKIREFEKSNLIFHLGKMIQLFFKYDVVNEKINWIFNNFITSYLLYLFYSTSTSTNIISLLVSSLTLIFTIFHYTKASSFPLTRTLAMLVLSGDCTSLA